MGEFGTSFLFAVLFGSATLVGFAVVRFQVSAAQLPKDFVDLGLTPRLLTRPEMYTLGLSTYVAALLAVYYLVTLFPDAVLLIASKGNQDVASTISNVTRDRYSPAFPLAMALVLTSPAFIKFAEPPERLLRRFAQGIAGVPRDVGYVLEVIRSADFLSEAQVKESCIRLGISDVCAESIARRVWKQSGNLSTRTGDRLIARAIQFASHLRTVRLAEVGAQPEGGDRLGDGGRAALWQQVDFAVFANFWQLAQPRIDRLRDLITLVHEEAEKPTEASPVQAGSDKALCLTAPAPWEREVEALQADLSALLAASISTRSVHLNRIVRAFALFQLEPSQEKPVLTADLRVQLVKIQGIGIRTRNQIAQYLCVACISILMLGLILAPASRSKIDNFNRELVAGPLSSAVFVSLVSRFIDPAGLALPDRTICSELLKRSRDVSVRRTTLEACAEKLFGRDKPMSDTERKLQFELRAAPFEWDWGKFALLISYTGMACGVGSVLAYKRRNENLAKSFSVVGERSDAIPAISFAGVADMFRVALPAALVFSLLGQLGPLTEWARPISQVVQETKSFAQAINDETAQLGVKVEVGDGQVQAYLVIGLGMVVIVVAGGLGPAMVAVVGIAAGELFARGSESRVLRSRVDLLRYVAVFVACSACAAVPVVAGESVESLQRWIYSGGLLEQTIKVTRLDSAKQGREIEARCDSAFGLNPKSVDDRNGCICLVEQGASTHSTRWTEILECRQRKKLEDHAAVATSGSRNAATSFILHDYKVPDGTMMEEGSEENLEREVVFLREAVFEQLRNISSLYRSAILMLLYSAIFIVVARFAYVGRKGVLALAPLRG